MEVTTEQRQQNAQLNQDRSETNNEKLNLKQNVGESSPDILALIVFLPLAIAADILGGLDITGFGAIIVRIVDIPILGILWLWRIMKQGTGKNYTYQLLLTFLVEISPFGIIPTWTTFVLYCYFKDTKLGKQTIGRAEKLQSKNITK